MFRKVLTSSCFSKVSECSKATQCSHAELRCAPQSYAVLCCTTQCNAELRNAELCCAMLCSAIEDVCLATPDPRSKTYASRAIAARRSAIKGVCLATPDPRSKTCASRATAARRSAVKGVCIATPDPRSKTDALAASLQFALLVMCVSDTRFPLPLLTQISGRQDFLIFFFAAVS